MLLKNYKWDTYEIRFGAPLHLFAYFILGLKILSEIILKERMTHNRNMESPYS